MESKDHNLTNGFDASFDLKALLTCCSDVDEFRVLLEEHGIWLNRRAAESAFRSLNTVKDEQELDDSSLNAVTGGVALPVSQSSLLSELLEALRFS